MLTCMFNISSLASCSDSRWTISRKPCLVFSKCVKGDFFSFPHMTGVRETLNPRLLSLNNIANTKK